MAELWGSILRGLGSALSSIYEVIPLYGVAIILLTMAVRALMIPLTIKQIRSMTAMQRIQPELKRLQAEHKGDRQKLNEEMMKLYKEHGVNPLGGCLPLLAQSPVFIALFSVLRASIFAAPATLLLVTAGTGSTQQVPSDLYTEKQAAEVICRPSPDTPSATGSSPTEILCADVEDPNKQQLFRVSDWRGSEGEKIDAPWVALCRPQVRGEGDAREVVLNCGSRFGTGHLPVDSALFQDITRDQDTFLGMHLSCSLQQAQSKERAKQCTSDPNGGGGTAAIPYYVLLGLVVGTTYYQSKQMLSRATGQAAQQQKMMTRIMPIFIGFISFSFPAGVIVYWVTTNVWTIVQQAIVLKKQDAMGLNPAALEAEIEQPPKPTPPKKQGGGKQQRKKRK